MQIIKTSMPPVVPVTPDYRQTIARLLGKYIPGNPTDFVPCALDAADGAYTIDSHNDWWCRISDDDSRLVFITYRHADRDPARELAFARWVTSWARGWQLCRSEAADEVCRLAQEVTFNVSMPYKVEPENLDGLTFSIPVGEILVFMDGAQVRGARVVSYTTTTSAEEVSHVP